jgi:ribosomal protein L24E
MKLEICVFCGRQVITSSNDLMVMTDAHEDCLQNALKKLGLIQRKNRKRKSFWYKVFLVARKFFRS